METHEQVWILDDGELAELRQRLDEIGVPHADTPASGALPGARGGALVFITPRHALAASPRAAQIAGAVQIVIADRLTRTTRAQLERSSCDYIIEWPVDPPLLRNLIQHVLYRGDERRGRGRVALSAKAKLRHGRRSIGVRLVSLSERGCGVQVDDARDRDGDVVLVLPRDLTGGRALDLPGRVLSVEPAPDGGRRIAIAFQPLAAGTLAQVRAILERAGGSGVSLTPSARPAPAVAKPTARKPAQRAPSPPPEPPPTEESGAERRHSPRRAYAKPLMASGDGYVRSLVGRDLSLGGMRVGPSPDLALGDELKIALYGRKGDKPVVVVARVVREDGRAGFGLRFVNLGADVTERLGKLVEGLPVLGRDRRSSTGRGEIVVSEVLDHKRRRG